MKEERRLLDYDQCVAHYFEHYGAMGAVFLPKGAAGSDYERECCDLIRAETLAGRSMEIDLYFSFMFRDE